MVELFAELTNCYCSVCTSVVLFEHSALVSCDSICWVAVKITLLLASPESDFFVFESGDVSVIAIVLYWSEIAVAKVTGRDQTSPGFIITSSFSFALHTDPLRLRVKLQASKQARWVLVLLSLAFSMA